MHVQDIRIVMLIFIAAAFLVTGCATSSPVTYYEDSDTLKKNVQEVLNEMGMAIENVQDKPDGGFRINSVNRSGRQPQNRTEQSSDLIRMNVEAERQDDGSFEINLEVPSARNYGSATGANLPREFNSKLRERDLDTGDTMAEANDNSDQE